MPVVTGTAQPGEGTILSITIATVVTPIAEVVEIDGPKVMVEAIDTTVLAGPLVISRPSRFPEPDKVTLKTFFDPNDNVTFPTLVTDTSTPKAIELFTITFNDHVTTKSTCVFSGFFTSFGLNGMKKGSNLGADVEIQMTSLPVFTAGSG